MISQFLNDCKPVMNHFIINDAKGITLQSYTTLVARISKRGKVTLSSYWDYSKTTCKNVCRFLSDAGFNLAHKKDIQKAINDKKIKVVSTLA